MASKWNIRDISDVISGINFFDFWLTDAAKSLSDFIQERFPAAIATGTSKFSLDYCNDIKTHRYFKTVQFNLTDGESANFQGTGNGGTDEKLYFKSINGTNMVLVSLQIKDEIKVDAAVGSGEEDSIYTPCFGTYDPAVGKKPACPSNVYKLDVNLNDFSKSDEQLFDEPDASSYDYCQGTVVNSPDAAAASADASDSSSYNLETQTPLYLYDVLWQLFIYFLVLFFSVVIICRLLYFIFDKWRQARNAVYESDKGKHHHHHHSGKISHFEKLRFTKGKDGQLRKTKPGKGGNNNSNEGKDGGRLRDCNHLPVLKPEIKARRASRRESHLAGLQEHLTDNVETVTTWTGRKSTVMTKPENLSTAGFGGAQQSINSKKTGLGTLNVKDKSE